jgi:hypothetical protein
MLTCPQTGLPPRHWASTLNLVVIPKMAASFRIPGQKPLQVPLGLTSASPALKMGKPGGSAGLVYRIAPSFNGRTAASGAAYRGSNPWGATNISVLSGLSKSRKVQRSSSPGRHNIFILNMILVCRRPSSYQESRMEMGICWPPVSSRSKPQMGIAANSCQLFSPPQAWRCCDAFAPQSVRHAPVTPEGGTSAC